MLPSSLILYGVRNTNCPKKIIELWRIFSHIVYSHCFPSNNTVSAFVFIISIDINFQIYVSLLQLCAGFHTLSFFRVIYLQPLPCQPVRDGLLQSPCQLLVRAILAWVCFRDKSENKNVYVFKATMQVSLISIR